MPYTEVMHKFKAGTLKSGGSGKPVKKRSQAIAIMLSEKRAAKAGKSEYKPKRKGMSLKSLMRAS
jgi:hypothetical protein